MKTILVIDDSEDFRHTICDILLDNDFDVWDAACPDDAFGIIRREKIDLIICDIHMPFTLSEERRSFECSHRVGIRTIEELGWLFPQMPIIAVTSAMPLDLERIRRAIGKVPTLSKPFTSHELLAVIEHSFDPLPGEIIQ